MGVSFSPAMLRFNSHGSGGVNGEGNARETWKSFGRTSLAGGVVQLSLECEVLRKRRLS